MWTDHQALVPLLVVKGASNRESGYVVETPCTGAVRGRLVHGPPCKAFAYSVRWDRCGTCRFFVDSAKHFLLHLAQPLYFHIQSSSLPFLYTSESASNHRSCGRCDLVSIRGQLALVNDFFSYPIEAHLLSFDQLVHPGTTMYFNLNLLTFIFLTALVTLLFREARTRGSLYSTVLPRCLAMCWAQPVDPSVLRLLLAIVLRKRPYCLRGFRYSTSCAWTKSSSLLHLLVLVPFL